jgi:hypothetical protein
METHRGLGGLWEPSQMNSPEDRSIRCNLSDMGLGSEIGAHSYTKGL